MLKSDVSDNSDGDYEPYVPVRKRKIEQIRKLASESALAKIRRIADLDEAEEVERRERNAALIEQQQKQDDGDADEAAVPQGSKHHEEALDTLRKTREGGVSLFEQHAKLKKRDEADVKKDEMERKLKDEEQLFKVVAEKTALMGVAELAKGLVYTKVIQAGGYVPPRHLRAKPPDYFDKLRKKMGIIVEGEDVPLVVNRFEDLKLPKPVMEVLQRKEIFEPTAIQAQTLPCALMGRDLLGIAYTGSGKTLAFSLPCIQFCLEQELKFPFTRNEGPFGLILCPSRELARQTWQCIDEFADNLAFSGRFPRLRAALCIGGVPLKEQMPVIEKGVHIVIATPGRLIQLLESRKMTLETCRYLVMDEADRMISTGFEDVIRTIFSFFRCQRQTLLFSATMPKKIQNFARTALVKPVTINVGRAGAASMNVTQDVEHVAVEDRYRAILDALAKTSPPTLIFAEQKVDVDGIHEYLLLKGVAAVAIHGDLSQEDRSASVDMFKARQKDVLIASDVASKGLDFPDVRHVINFSMPGDIEDYVHRIGRTGRRKHQIGHSTTFVDAKVDISLLLDLKHLLIEAKQRVPPFLAQLRGDDEPEVESGADRRPEDRGGASEKGCSYCGGLGHRITRCPKLANAQNRAINSQTGKGGEGI